MTKDRKPGGEAPESVEVEGYSVRLSIPTSQFPRIQFFDRFRIRQEGEYLLVTLALEVSLGVPDIFAFAVPLNDLVRVKESLERYLEAIGPAESTADDYALNDKYQCGYSCATSLHFARISNQAELLLYYHPLFHILNAGKHQGGEVEATPVAVLRSDLEIVRHLIIAMITHPIIYKEE